MTARPRRPRDRALAMLCWALAAAGGIAMIIPVATMLSASLKDASAIYDPAFLPRAPTLANYRELLSNGQFLTWLANSFGLATFATTSNLFFDSLVGYTLARLRFRGRDLVFVTILSTVMVPTEMLVIPWYSLARSLGWLDSYWGIVFPGMMTAFGTFLMRQFFLTVPEDFLEAARIDGLGEFHIWWEVALPMVTPALSAVAIFTFLGNWTAFLWPLIVTTSQRLYTLPVGLASFAAEQETHWELVMTGASIATLPALAIFLLFRRYIVRGVLLTGLKG